MDEAQFHATRNAVAARPCVFEKALAVRCADCAPAVHARYGSLLDLPWPAVVDAIAKWKSRRRFDAGNPR